MIYVLISILLLSSLAKSEDEGNPRLLRVQRHGSNNKIVTMSDGELIVNLLMNSNGKMEDCKVTRRGRLELGMLKYDVDSMSGDDGLVEYLDQKVDVQWYGRECSRFRSKANAPGERRFEEVRAREKLDNMKGYPGTKFCSRFGSAYHPRYNEADNQEDECCRVLKQCDFTIPYLSYRHGYLNVLFHDMYTCDCVEQFKGCLESIDSDLSRTLQKTYFDYLGMKCFDLELVKTCEEYSQWFDTCQNEFQFLRAIVK